MVVVNLNLILQTHHHFFNSTTYSGVIAMAENTNNLFFATVSGWITLLTENDSINVLSDVDTTTNVVLWTSISI